MGEFTILTNRQQALLDPVHSIVFPLIAFQQMIAASPAAEIWLPATVSTGTWSLCGTHVIVSAIRLWLCYLAWLDRKTLLRYVRVQQPLACSARRRATRRFMPASTSLSSRCPARCWWAYSSVRMHSECAADS
jgi:hypothetical protein